MRDPSRIPRMIRKLSRLWKHNPDMRLGQLIVNLVQPIAPHPEVYYREDDLLESEMDRWLIGARGADRVRAEVEYITLDEALAQVQRLSVDDMIEVCKYNQNVRDAMVFILTMALPDYKHVVSKYAKGNNTHG